MRTALFPATVLLVAAAARAQPAPAAAPTTEQTAKSPAQPPPAPAQPPKPAAEKPAEAAPAAVAGEKPGEAPSIPTGETETQASVPVPDSGPLAAINVQGNRRVETDAIKTAVPLKAGDTYDKERLKAALLAVWRMGYFSDVKLDVSPAHPPLEGYTLTVMVAEKPAIRDIKPSPALCIAAVRDHVIANQLVVVPHRLFLAVITADARRRSRLFAIVKSFLVADQQVALDAAAGRA